MQWNLKSWVRGGGGEVLSLWVRITDGWHIKISQASEAGQRLKHNGLEPIFAFESRPASTLEPISIIPLSNSHCDVVVVCTSDPDLEITLPRLNPSFSNVNTTTLGKIKGFVKKGSWFNFFFFFQINLRVSLTYLKWYRCCEDFNNQHSSFSQPTLEFTQQHVIVVFVENQFVGL